MILGLKIFQPASFPQHFDCKTAGAFTPPKPRDDGCGDVRIHMGKACTTDTTTFFNDHDTNNTVRRESALQGKQPGTKTLVVFCLADEPFRQESSQP